MTTVYDDIENPKELFKFINENFTEGFIDRFNGKIHLPTDKNYYKILTHFRHYRTKDFLHFTENKYATLFDKIEFARFWFEKNKYNYKVIFIGFDFPKKLSLPHHVYIVYKEDNLDKVFYYMEFSDKYQKGMHRFTSYKKAINFQRDDFIARLPKTKIPKLEHLKLYHYDHIFNASYEEYIDNTCDIDSFAFLLDHTKSYY